MLRSSIVYRRLWYVRKRNIKRLHTMLRLLAAALILSFIALFLGLILMPGLKEASEDTIQKAVGNAANAAVYPDMPGNLSFMELMKEYRGYAGEIQAIEPDYIKIKELSDEISDRIHESLEASGINKVYVPFALLFKKDGVYDSTAPGPAIGINVYLDGEIETSCSVDTINLGEGRLKHVLSLDAYIPVRYSGFLIKGRTALTVHIASGEAVLSDNDSMYSLK